MHQIQIISRNYKQECANNIFDVLMSVRIWNMNAYSNHSQSLIIERNCCCFLFCVCVCVCKKLFLSLNFFHLIIANALTSAMQFIQKRDRYNGLIFVPGTIINISICIKRKKKEKTKLNIRWKLYSTIVYPSTRLVLFPSKLLFQFDNPIKNWWPMRTSRIRFHWKKKFN